MAYNLWFYGCCCFCGLGLWPGRDSVFSVLICLCISRLKKKGRLEARCMSLNWNGKYTLYVLFSVLLCWKPTEARLVGSCLSGRYICSHQQGGQEIAFDLTLIRLNIFGHSIRAPLNWLPSVLVWSLSLEMTRFDKCMFYKWLEVNCCVIGSIIKMFKLLCTSAIMFFLPCNLGSLSMCEVYRAGNSINPVCDSLHIDCVFQNKVIKSIKKEIILYVIFCHCKVFPCLRLCNRSSIWQLCALMNSNLYV